MFGETGLFLDKNLSKDTDFINLKERLNLDLTDVKIDDFVKSLEVSLRGAERRGNLEIN